MCEWVLGDGAGFSNGVEISATVQLAEKSWSRCAVGPCYLLHLVAKVDDGFAVREMVPCMEMVPVAMA